ncbi:alpha/beta hydrolase [Hymenobacter sp. RP-2-7]|uniref:Alpha/beta hydrolase n=1 Tax=Hymenobacter polaris TaxID=2682546 RepID=A0A7Y0FPW9_9BACT|nr:alpha/beta hydrolase [Hymenobacter polaris]NML68011.1 alpha/beta hydrolase [Hymenobacter polaris]
MLPFPVLLALPQGPTVAVYDSGSSGPVLLLLAGNSLSSASTYGALWAEPALAGYRRVAFDWPGCGASPWAPAWYGLEAPARVLALVVATLDLPATVVVGHSLGGHLALHALPRLPLVRGLLLVGTPPLGAAADFAHAFLPEPRMGLLYQAELSDAELAQLLPALLQPAAPASQQAPLAEALRQSDPAFRPALAAAIGAGVPDEQAILRATAVPVAFALGEADALVSAAYLGATAAPTRWGALVHLVAGAGHTPMLETPAAFATLLAEFAAAVLPR